MLCCSITRRSLVRLIQSTIHAASTATQITIRAKDISGHSSISLTPDSTGEKKILRTALGHHLQVRSETPTTSPLAPDARGESRSILRRRPTPRASHCRPGYPPPQTPPAGWSREAVVGATAATPSLPASRGRDRGRLAQSLCCRAPNIPPATLCAARRRS